MLWGTVDALTDETVRALHKRYGVRDGNGWGRHYDRFDVTKEPYEPLRFGWVVEVDPYDPVSVPTKRTALGRFRHEAATTVISRDVRAVVYSGVDKANPRPENKHGHIIEIVRGRGEHSATTLRWELFIACGDPNKPDDKAFYQGHKDVTCTSCPDNVAFDDAGRLWVATDGQPASIKKNDAVYMVEGPQRGMAKMFLSGLPGGEICEPEFTPDNQTFFVAIQRPGEAKGSGFGNPISRFPDYRPDMPPRLSVVAIYRSDGGKVGS